MKRAGLLAVVGFSALVGLGLGASGTARADSLDAGKELYHQLDYSGARIELIRAAALTDAHRRAEAYLYLGLINMVEGDESGARQSFQSALLLDHGLQLPKGTSPKIRKFFDDIAVQIAREEQPSPPPAPPPVVAAPPSTTAPVAPQPAPPRSVSIVPIPVPGTEKSSPPAHGPLWVPLTLIGLGVAAAAVGAGFGVAERSDESAFNSATYQSAAVAARNNANTHALVADVCYGGAAVLAIAGAVVWISF